MVDDGKPARTRISISDVRRGYTSEKKHRDMMTTPWTYFVLRPISFYITPVKSEKILKTLKTKVGQIESSISSKMEKGEVRDPMLQTALHDVEAMRDRLIQGTEKFFHFAFYITIYTDSKKELEEKTKVIENILGQRLIYSRRAIFQAEQGFNTTLPYGKDEIGVVNSMNTGPLSTSYPFVSSELTSNDGILYGINGCGVVFLLLMNF